MTNDEKDARIKRLEDALKTLREWDMLCESSWLADAKWARDLIDKALSGD